MSTVFLVFGFIGKSLCFSSSFNSLCLAYVKFSKGVTSRRQEEEVMIADPAVVDVIAAAQEVDDASVAMNIGVGVSVSIPIPSPDPSLSPDPAHVPSLNPAPVQAPASLPVEDDTKVQLQLLFQNILLFFFLNFQISS